MTRIHYCLFCAILAGGFIALASANTLAKPKRGGGGGGGKQSSGGYSGAASTEPSPGSSQITQDLADLKAAETAVDETFETSSEWLAAQAAVKQAQSDYNDSSGPVLDALKQQQAYKDALDAQTKADANLTDLRTTGSPDDISDAAKSAMQAHSTVKDLESKALASDPTAVAAKQRLTSTFAAVASLHQKEQDAVHADPAWLAAKKRLDSARAN